MKSIAQQIAWFIGLVALQVLVFNHIQLAYLINPFPYIYLLLVLPNRQNRAVTVAEGFILGLVIDALSSTWGIHTAATTLAAYMAPAVLRLFARPEQMEKDVPELDQMGPGFVAYAASIIVAHHLVLFALEAFSLRLLPMALLKTVTSGAITLMIVLLLEKIRYARAHGKR